MLFAAEEHGRFGSQAFVADVIEGQAVPLEAVLVLDMIGSPAAPDGTARTDRVRAYSAPPDDSPSRQLAYAVAAIAGQHVPGITVTVQDTLDRNGRWGDHQSFSDAGYAAVRLIEPFDDPARMHNANDLPEHLDPAYLLSLIHI